MLILAKLLLVGAVLAAPPILGRIAAADGRIDNNRMVVLLWVATFALLTSSIVCARTTLSDPALDRVAQLVRAWRRRVAGGLVLLIILGSAGLAWYYRHRNHVDLIDRLNPAHSRASAWIQASGGAAPDTLISEMADYFADRSAFGWLKPAAFWMEPAGESARRRRAILSGDLVSEPTLPLYRWTPGEAIHWRSPTPMVILHRLQVQLFLFDLLMPSHGKPSGDAIDFAEAYVNLWRKDNQIWPNWNQSAWNDEAMSYRIQAHMLLQEALREADRTNPAGEIVFLQSLIQHADQLMDDRLHNFLTNHGMMQNCALLAIAAAYPEFDREQLWRRTAIARMKRHLEEGVSTDGVFLELTPHYHYYAICKLLWFVTTARQADIELEPYFEQTLRRMLVFAREILNPDGTLPMIADTYPGKVDISNWPWEALPDWPELAALREATSTLGEPPNEPTARLWPKSGYFVLRAPAPDWTHESAMMLTFKAGPRSRAHLHYDALSITFFAHGRPWLTGPGYPGYESSQDRLRLIGTPSQNTVSVDGRSQRAGGASVRFVETDPDSTTATQPTYAVIQGESRLYDGVAHRRTVLYGPEAGAALLIDELVSDQPHVYRQHYRRPDGIEAQTSAGQILLTLPAGVDDAAGLEIDSWVLLDGSVIRPPVRMQQQVADFGVYAQSVTFVTLLDSEPSGAGQNVEVAPGSVTWHGERGAAVVTLPIESAKSCKWTPHS